MDSPRISLCSRGLQSGKGAWESNRLLRVGRLQDIEVLLEDPSVSRQHAEVAFTDGGWAVRDLGSTNGTFLNGVRVGRTDKPLKEGDVLQFGDIIMNVAVLKGHTSKGPDGTGQVRHAVRLSWEDLPGLALSDRLPQGNGKHPLLALVWTGRDFYNHTSLDEFLATILWEA